VEIRVQGDVYTETQIPNEKWDEFAEELDKLLKKYETDYKGE